VDGYVSVRQVRNVWVVCVLDGPGRVRNSRWGEVVARDGQDRQGKVGRLGLECLGAEKHGRARHSRYGMVS